MLLLIKIAFQKTSTSKADLKSIILKEQLQADDNTGPCFYYIPCKIKF